MGKVQTKGSAKLTPEEISEQMRERVMTRWRKADPNRNKPTADAVALVSLACSMGATVGRICEVLDISPKKFRKFMQESPEFAEAVKAGRSIEHDALVNKLTEVALSGNVAAICFALKSRHNYVDQGAGTAALVENTVSINFVLPDSLSPEKYLKALTVSAQIIAPDAVTGALEQPGVKNKVLRQLSIERSEADAN